MKFEWLTKLLSRRWVNLGLSFLCSVVLFLAIFIDSVWYIPVMTLAAIWMGGQALWELHRSAEEPPFDHRG